MEPTPQCSYRTLTLGSGLESNCWLYRVRATGPQVNELAAAPRFSLTHPRGAAPRAGAPARAGSERAGSDIDL